VYFSSSHSAKHKIEEDPTYIRKINDKKDILNPNEVLIKGEIFELIEVNGALCYKDRYCKCGCGELVRYLKTHSHNGVPNGLPRHIHKTSTIDYSKLFEKDGIFYYKDKLCKCGCGKNLRFYQNVEHLYIKGHQLNDPEYIEKRNKIFNTEDHKLKNGEALKRHYAEVKAKEELDGYITIKGGIKEEIEVINGIKYYKNFFCKCGCDGKIKVTKSSVRNGVPDYLENHWNLARKTKIIIEDGVECHKDSVCACGCGKSLPISRNRTRNRGRKYIDGHKARKTELQKTEYLKANEDLIEIDGIMYYRDIYCKCGCGNRIKYKNQHKYFGIPKYIGKHFINDEVFMENLRKSSRARALDQLSQDGSYAQTGTYQSLKNNSSIAYDSSYELKAMKIFESDLNVSVYSRCKIKISYELDGVSHYYFPDFLVCYSNKQKIIEVKPDKFLNSSKNLAKFAAAREYCAQNNIEFEVWTEKDLNINKKK